MRRAVTPAIPPKLYRHFAIMTVVLTGGVAMFADGENREAQAASVEPAPPVRSAAPAAIVRASRASAHPQAPGWWEADDSGPDPEAPGGTQFGESSDFDGEAVSGYPPEYLDSLSERERELLLGGLQENGMLEPEIGEQRSAGLIAASSRRSGSASQGD